MKTNKYDYRSLLLREFEIRRQRNSAYSLRAFARDLSVSPTALSQVLNFKRKFSISSARKVATGLRLPENEREKFILLSSSTTKKVLRPSVKWKIIKDDKFRLIADWYYFAILNLAMIPNCKSDPKWLAQRLNLDAWTTELAVTRLERLGLLKIKKNRLHRVEEELATTDDIPSKAIQSHHKQKLQLAQSALDKVPVHSREMLSLTFPVSPEKIKEIKSKIRQFADVITNSKGDHPKEVYSLNIQFFPLTK